MTAPRILLAAGGTGGHMFPAEALARALLARGLAVDLATDERGGGFGDRLPQVKVHRIASGGVAGLTDLTALRDAGCDRIEGVIIGRALYDGRIKPGEALALFRY